jgi:O-methyltransferase involved in polyketide biosynthesis
MEQGKEFAMSEKIAVDLGNVQKTLFLPLWGRAFESKKEKPLLIDKTALEIIEKVDYDFATITQNISPLSQAAWIMRSLIIDRTVKKFLERYPRATIVNVGCGMDTTFERVDNGSLRWYDLDLPDVIELRRKFIPETERRIFISASLLENDWLGNIKVDENVLFIIAGVLYYFEETQVKDFFIRIANAFPGCEAVFDVSSPRGIKVANQQVIKNSGLDERSYLKWGLTSPAVISGWDKRFKILGTHFYYRGRGSLFGFRVMLIGLLSDFLKIQYMLHLGIIG